MECFIYLRTDPSVHSHESLIFLSAPPVPPFLLTSLMVGLQEGLGQREDTEGWATGTGRVWAGRGGREGERNL